MQTLERILTVSACIITVLAAACSPAGGLPATAAPTAAPSPTPALTAVSEATATPAATPGVSLGATTNYTDGLVGFALDYPADWHIVAVNDEIKAQSLSYSASIASFSMEGPGTDGIPAGGTKLDVTVIKSAAADLDAALAEWTRQNDAADPKQTVLTEEDLTLPSGINARSLRVESMFGQAEVVIAAINGHMLVISGLGDVQLFDAIVQTLRPAPTQAS